MKNLNKDQKKLAAIYVRSATLNRHDNNKTVWRQIAEIAEYAAKNGYKIIKTYIDLGFSGLTLNRPNLKKMCKDMKKGHFEAIIIYDRSRLSRDEAGFMILKNEMETNGITLISVAYSPELSGLFGQKDLTKKIIKK